MKQRGAVIGAFVFGVVVASAVAITIAFLRENHDDERVGGAVQRLVGARTPVACATPNNGTAQPIGLADRIAVGGVQLSVPAGYGFSQGAQAPSSPPFPTGDVQNYSIRGPGNSFLRLAVYATIGDYLLFETEDLAGSLATGRRRHRILLPASTKSLHTCSACTLRRASSLWLRDAATGANNQCRACAGWMATESRRSRPWNRT